MKLSKYFIIVSHLLLIFFISGCNTTKNPTVTTSFTPEYSQNIGPTEPANRMVNVMTHY